MLYLVTLYRYSDDECYENWDDNTVIGVFDSLSSARDAVIDDYKERSCNGTDIEKTVNENGDEIYDGAVEYSDETIMHQWSIEAIKVNEILTKKKGGTL